MDYTPEEFLRAVAGRDVAEALESIDELILGVRDWPEGDCREWVEPMLLHGQVPELDPSFMRLVESILRRLADLRAPSPDVTFWDALLGRCCDDSMTLSIPRRYLIPQFGSWIETGCEPTVCGYVQQALRSATAAERAEICRLALRSSVENRIDLLSATMRDARDITPEILTDVLGEVIAEGTEFQKAEGRAMQTWCGRVPSSRQADLPPIPDRLLEHCTGLGIDRPALREAENSLAASLCDRWAVDRRVFQSMLERDSRLIEPMVVPAVKTLLCEAARSVLHDYLRLERVGGTSKLGACSMLTLAIEAQARHELSRDLDVGACKKLAGAGLAELGALVEGRSTLKLAALEVKEAPAKVRNLLVRAGTIRNRVHHEPSRLSDTDADDLQCMIFGPAGTAGELLAGLKTLRATRRGEAI